MIYISHRLVLSATVQSIMRLQYHLV